MERMVRGTTPEDYPEPEVSLAGPALLPEGYVSDPGQKLHLYRRLSRSRSRAEVDALADEIEDRFGRLPVEVRRLLGATVLRLLGRRAGVERILVRDRTARITFRQDVMVHLAALERPLREGLVALEVRRMAPLSVVLHQEGAEPLTDTIIAALETLQALRSDAA